MRILHINSYYFGSIFYKNFFDKQIDTGIDLDVFVPTSYKSKQLDLDLGKYTNISRNHNKYDRLFFYYKHNKIYKDLLKKYELNKYNIIHAHSLFSNGYIAWKLKKKFGLPYLVAVRDTDVNIFFKKMFHMRKIGNEILFEANKIVFLSESYRDYVLKNYIKEKDKKFILAKSHIIPNGIDDFWFRNKAKPRKANLDRNINLLFVGSISKRKNVTTTIKAVQILIQKGYNVNFTIVGPIMDKSIYKSFKDLSFVNYIGSKSKEEILHIYRSNDIFVMPSLTETFGLVYAEAMSQGIPIIYSRGQGFDGQFEEGVVGYSTSATNPNEIAERVEDIMKYYKEISTNCIERVQKFNWISLVHEYKNLYLKIYEKENN